MVFLIPGEVLEQHISGVPTGTARNWLLWFGPSYIILIHQYLYSFSMWNFHSMSNNLPLLHVSYFLSLTFETYFLGPWISPTSSLLPLGFFFLLHIIYEPLTLSINMCPPHTLIHGNSIRLYLWEPCIASFFSELASVGNSLCIFFPLVCGCV